MSAVFCLHRHTLPCATFRSPHTAWCVSIFCHRVLADYGPPIAAARPLMLGHGTLYLPPHCCCQVQKSLIGPCTAIPCCCLSIRHNSAHVPTFMSPYTCWCVFHFL
ncbi:unnamed protein product, partial [Staurois parvus]